MKRSFLNYICIVCVFVSTISVNAQNNIMDLLKSDRKRADELFENKSYLEASDLYRKIVSKDSSDVSLMFNLAESLKFLQKTQESEFWFAKAFRKGEEGVLPEYKFQYAEVLLSNGKKEEAYKWYKEYNKENQSDQVGMNKVKALEGYQNFYRDSLLYSVWPITINSKESDFCPTYYENGIVFLSGRKNDELIKRINAYDEGSFMDLYYAKFLGDTAFAEPQEYNLLNYRHHEGPVTFFDKDSKVIFSANVKDKSTGISRLALYYSEKTKKDSMEWTIPVLLPFNNLKYSSSHPCFDENTQTLYYVSDMPGGYGETDIYKTTFLNNEWSSPVNLGREINTSGKELFPFVSMDSSLYFTSNGHPGMGALDLFMYDLKDSLVDVSNLGYPVNSSKDDFAMIIEKNGKKGLFSSNRNAASNDDIYLVEIHRVRFDGFVIDKLKAAPQEEVSVIITELESGKTERVLKTNKYGRFRCFIKPGRHYKAETFKKGFRVAAAEVYSGSKENTVIKKTFVIDKINKTYVNGNIVDDETKIGNCRVSIVDFNSDSIETFTTDSTGWFQSEINTDTTNIFYMEKEDLKGICVLEPVKNKKKGSRVIFLTLEFKEISTKKINGILKNEAGAPIAKDTLFLVNQLNGEELIVFSDEAGKFEANLWEYGKYKVFVKEKNERIFSDMIIPSQKDFFEIIKGLKLLEE